MHASLRNILVASLLLPVGGCAMTEAGGNHTPSFEGTRAVSWPTPYGMLEIDYAYKSGFAALWTHVRRKEAPIPSGPREDELVQNAIRDALGKAAVCPEGTFPGILQFGYGNLGNGEWQAYVRCTPVHQKNVPVGSLT